MGNAVSIDDLYNAIGNVITTVTGLEWWREEGIQSQPQGPYATIHLLETGSSSVVDVVETIEIPGAAIPNPSAYEAQWGLTTFSCKVKFRRGGFTGAGSAYGQATRFKNSLLLSDRMLDLYTICGLCGGQIELINTSAIFQNDTEPRAEVRFNLNACIATPLPLPDTSVYTIEQVEVDVYLNDTNHPVGTVRESKPSGNP